jgi:hypothetical protein
MKEKHILTMVQYKLKNQKEGFDVPFLLKKIIDMG